jgi:hypothetical protein
MTTSRGYTVADALETLAACQLAGASMAEARAFIAAGTPIAAVREQLLDKRASATEGEHITSQHAAQSDPARAWDAAIAAANKSM